MILSRKIQLLIEIIIVTTAASIYYKLYYGVRRLSLESTSWPPSRSDAAPLWCGKAYQAEWPAIDPGGRAKMLAEIDETVLDFECYTRMNTYFHGESVAEVVFVLKPTTKVYPRARYDKQYIVISNDSAELLQLSLNGQELSTPMISKTKVITFQIDLDDFSASLSPSLLSCSVRSVRQASQLYRTAELYHLPPRLSQTGSMTKLDRTSGLIMINSTTRGEPQFDWTPLNPIGYYGTPSNLQELVDYGFNVLHIVPDLPNTLNYGYPEDYHSILQEAADLGIWVMHDMRWSWQDPILLQRQVALMKDTTNLLTWYTGDEPDGTTSDPNDFVASTQLLRDLDSRYHVVSSVFNCADFYLSEYTTDIDVVMSDPYPLGLVPNHVSIYGTTCNATYGCCGCDLCDGTVFDVSARLDRYKTTLQDSGRRPALWIVTQAFGKAEHWKRLPTVRESIAMQILALNHGSTGSVSWNWVQQSSDHASIRSAISKVAKFVLPNTGMIALGNRRQVIETGNVDVTVWRNESYAMIGYVNANEHDQHIQVSALKGGRFRLIDQLCETHVSVSDNGIITFTQHEQQRIGVDILLFELLN